jgi:hypothetical protein
MLLISVHLINIARQSKLMHNVIVYLFNLCLLVHLPDMSGR